MYKFRYLLRFGYCKGLALLVGMYVYKKGMAKINLPKQQHPFWLRRNTSDIKVFEQIFLYKEYDVSVQFKPRFIIDAGANIGLGTIYFAERFPDATIVAIEPEPGNFKLLQKNTLAYPKVQCRQNGLWHRTAFLEVQDVLEMGNWGFICKEVPTPTPTTIAAISVAELLQQMEVAVIDIFKIDIEGAELELFSTAYETWLPYTNMIIIEMHDWFRKGCSKAFFKALVQYDFSVTLKGENLICVRNTLLT